MQEITEENIKKIFSDCINIEHIIFEEDGLILRGTLLLRSGAYKIIKERLSIYDLCPILRKVYEEEGNPLIELKIIKKPKIKKNNVGINILLFLLTILTTMVAGALLLNKNPFVNPKALLLGIPFSFALILILGVHELGHYLACKFNGVDATLPYFIPAPPPFPLGTFGAVIKIKTPIKDRNGLITVGAAGPIMGFILAVVITIIGLKYSKIIKGDEFIGGVGLGNSLIFSWLINTFVKVPDNGGYSLLLHPVAFAGWVGLFVTGLNLLPVGQLDGGHIIYALFSKSYKKIMFPMIGVLAVLSIYWQGWIFWMFILLFVIKVKHPPPLDEISPVDKKHKIIGIISILIFILTFVPVPFKLM